MPRTSEMQVLRLLALLHPIDEDLSMGPLCAPVAQDDKYL